MAKNEYQEGQTLLCPHCDYEQDGVAEDFIIARFPDQWVEDQCYECEEHFSVRRNPKTLMYEVKE